LKKAVGSGTWVFTSACEY